MSKKKEKRGRKALPPEAKKPPQPTVKINEALYPFVKLLKQEFKAKRVDAEKLAALSALLMNEINGPTTKKPTDDCADDNTEPKGETLSHP